MTVDPKTSVSRTGSGPAGTRRQSPQLRLFRLPGLAAIGFYMLLLAGTVILGVANKHFPPFCLVFSALFIAAGLGLLLMLRWAWALTLAAVALLSGLFTWEFFVHHTSSSLVQGLLNLVIFLYLVRTDVRDKLR
jgi:uncharacterized membrane protein (DUF2068 family)